MNAFSENIQNDPPDDLRPYLSWTYLGDGEWEAVSTFCDEGSDFIYRIGVCDDGTFDVSESDSELIGTEKILTKETFADAKAFCEGNESAMRAAAGVT